MKRKSQIPSEDDIQKLTEKLSHNLLKLHKPSPWHFQIKDEDNNILLNWWPSKGTTMIENKVGKSCYTVEDLIEIMELT